MEQLSDCQKSPGEREFSWAFSNVHGIMEWVMKVIEKAENKRNNIIFTDVEGLVPKDHLLRKVEKVLDFSRVYGLVEHLYSENTGRPATDPVVLVKLVFLQHLYGIKSLRQTVKEADMNIAYRWFLGYDLTTPIPHFATLSYAFSTRFPSEIFQKIFQWILEEADKKSVLDVKTTYLDATHIKANANKKKHRKVMVEKVARVYEEQLRKEINEEREKNGKKPFKDTDDGDENPPESKMVTESTTDPESGLFHKGEHKVEFAYSSHTVCDGNNFVLDCIVTPGNLHDSTVFDELYDKVTESFPEIETIAIDAGYKTPWICKKVFDSGRVPSLPYKRPMTKKGFFKAREYVYDEYYNCVICPNGQVLPYSTTNRNGYREFKSNPTLCRECPYLKQCTESKSNQKTVVKHIWEKYLDRAEDFRHTLAGALSYSRRAQTIERVFADAKEKHGMRYTLHRGIARVQNWVMLKFAAMNLKKLAMWAY